MNTLKPNNLFGRIKKILIAATMFNSKWGERVIKQIFRFGKFK